MASFQRCFSRHQIDLVFLFNANTSVVDPGLQEIAVAATNGTVLLLAS